ncbi:MAG: BatD family protein, partial [Saprospiraceae bacterium]|nr:BatD family protein [Saprospiraceae bacterium]
MAAHCPSDCSRKNAAALREGVWAAFFLFLPTLLLAQSGITFEAGISSKEVIVGVPFELSFTLKNAEGTRFSPPSFTGFRAGGISEMRGMSIVNGRSSTSQTWSLELTALKPGVYTIGPASITVGRQTLQTKPLTVKVLSVTAGSKGSVQVPTGDDKVFIAAEFDRKEAYIGQQLTWRIRLYTQLSVDGYDLISLPDFNGFYTREKIRFDKRVEYLSLKGKKYAVRTLYEEALFPQEEGELVVGAARVSVGIEQPGTQGFFFGPKPVTLQTQPVSIQVKALPVSTNEAFTGGVGRYNWQVKTDTNFLSTDDALTITVELTGN